MKEVLKSNGLGIIQAENIDNPNDEQTIRFGFYVGSGLLGDLCVAVRNLEQACIQYGYTGDEESINQVHDARIAFFQVARLIEIQGQNNA